MLERKLCAIENRLVFWKSHKIYRNINAKEKNKNKISI